MEKPRINIANIPMSVVNAIVPARDWIAGFSYVEIRNFQRNEEDTITFNAETKFTMYEPFEHLNKRIELLRMFNDLPIAHRYIDNERQRLLIGLSFESLGTYQQCHEALGFGPIEKEEIKEHNNRVERKCMWRGQPATLHFFFTKGYVANINVNLCKVSNLLAFLKSIFFRPLHLDANYTKKKFLRLF